MAEKNKEIWLKPWLQKLYPCGEVPLLLELGCGLGWDTLFLHESNYPCISSDISRYSLQKCGECAPGSMLLQFDLRQGLPFAEQQFPLIIASLCLHYFEWDMTARILKDIGRCLQDEGTLLCRLNSTKDFNYGASGHPQISPNFYQVGQRTKRFFNREDLDRLFLPDWEYEFILEKPFLLFGKTKMLWELVLHKRRE